MQLTPLDKLALGCSTHRHRLSFDVFSIAYPIGDVKYFAGQFSCLPVIAQMSF
jgi:hypothetical protein